jgi:hypothetical protein
MAMMARRSNMPVAAASEIERTIMHWYDDLIGHVMTAEASRALVRQDICNRLQAGTLETAWVIQAAEGGHQDADLALRVYAATFIDQGRESELLAQVRAYVVRSLLRPPVTYPRGTRATSPLRSWSTRQPHAGRCRRRAALRLRNRRPPISSGSACASAGSSSRSNKLLESGENTTAWRPGSPPRCSPDPLPFEKLSKGRRQRPRHAYDGQPTPRAESGLKTRERRPRLGKRRFLHF